MEYEYVEKCKENSNEYYHHNLLLMGTWGLWKNHDWILNLSLFYAHCLRRCSCVSNWRTYFSFLLLHNKPPQVWWPGEILLANHCAHQQFCSLSRGQLAVLLLVLPHAAGRWAGAWAQLGCWNGWIFSLYLISGASPCDFSFPIGPLHKFSPIE